MACLARLLWSRWRNMFCSNSHDGQGQAPASGNPESTHLSMAWQLCNTSTHWLHKLASGYRTVALQNTIPFNPRVVPRPLPASRTLAASAKLLEPLSKTSKQSLRRQVYTTPGAIYPCLGLPSASPVDQPRLALGKPRQG